MTQQQHPTPATWELATAYAAAFGLFAPGLLMANRRHALHSVATQLQGQSK